MSNNSLGIFYVSMGSLMLVAMASIAKFLGTRLPAFELLFFRSFVGFLFILPLFMRDPMEPFRTKRPGMHLIRGMMGSAGNFCFFWTITHMLLADSMALQFSRPLWTIPLAFFFLGEISNLRRTMVSVVGFVGVWMYARPFTAGFDPNALIGALGALFATLVVISIKRLSTTEPTRVIMFYYAVWNAIFSLVPAIFVWMTPTWSELSLLIVLGFLGIAGQGMITKGIHYGDATALAPLDYSRIVYAAAIGYVVFGEIPGWWSVAGMLLIVVASIYLVIVEKKKAA
jgi:drug/metabolite transporter (DMT)-like permease